ncbi:MAG: hypothetical protein R2909_12255 [Gemmatimonadales bacterium]
MGLAVAAASACGLFGPTSDDFVIAVDSIGGPLAVSAAVAFDQRLYGMVGPNGCYSLREVRMTRSPASAEVTVVGRRRNGAVCTQEPVYLGGVAVTIVPPVMDPFTLRVRQPDGSTLTKTIRVVSQQAP